MKKYEKEGPRWSPARRAFDFSDFSDFSLAAADMGLATAQSNAAHMFANGQGTPQHYQQAQI